MNYGYQAVLACGWKTGVHDCRDIVGYRHPWLAVHRPSGVVIGCWSEKDAKLTLRQIKVDYKAEQAALKAERRPCSTRIFQATNWRPLGSIPWCIALDAADIGEATLEDGSVVKITWGRNLTQEQQDWFIKHTLFCLIRAPMKYGSDKCEVMLPEGDWTNALLKTIQGNVLRSQPHARPNTVYDFQGGQEGS
jgi:hypothetical protein